MVWLFFSAFDLVETVVKICRANLLQNNFDQIKYYAGLAMKHKAEVGAEVPAAYAFLDFIMTPEIIGPITNEVYYANANSQAKPFVEKEILEDKTVYPDKAMMDKLFPESNPTQEIERLRTRIWTRVKTGS